MNYDIIVAVGIATAFLVVAVATVKLPTFRHVFRVPEGWTGLLYHDGLYVRRNNAGRHVIWGCGWTMNLIDLRKASLLVAGQKIFTADSASLKLSLLVTYQVTEPVKAAHETQNWFGDLYHTAQLALRAVVSGVAVETLLKQRLKIGTQLLARIQPEAVKIGIKVLGVEVKDVMFPAQLKRAFTNVPKAKQE